MDHPGTVAARDGDLGFDYWFLKANPADDDDGSCA